MICPRSWRSPITSKLLRSAIATALLASALAACSRTPVAEAPAPVGPPPGAEASVAPAPEPNSPLAGRFEWAVQNYEAGKYEEAIERFLKLRPFGAENPSFRLVPYYLGMSYFHTGRYSAAQAELRDYLAREPSGGETQEARLALLSVYERTQQWDALLGLAAETDQLTLFQNKRAFVKLLWARALDAKGEVKGARAVLNEATQYLAGDPDASARSAEPDVDLWGRYHYTRLLLDLAVCAGRAPREVASGKSGKRRLYPAWVDATSDCLRGALDLAVRELISRESAWAKPASIELNEALERFGERLNEYYADESARLERRRELQASARAGLYRLLTSIDGNLSGLNERRLPVASVEALRKRVDLLLVSLNQPT